MKLTLCNSGLPCLNKVLLLLLFISLAPRKIHKAHLCYVVS